MQTNFFQQLASLNIAANIRINIQSQPDKSMVVSILAVQDDLADKAVHKIPPLVLKGSANELDDGFFPKVSTPLQTTDGLITNLLNYQQSVDKAKGESRIQKDKEAADKKGREGKKKKYDEQMKKVNELEAKKMYRQAIGQMPDLAQYAEFADEIKKKIASLKSHIETPSLFGDVEETAAAATDETENETNDPFHATDPEENDDEDENGEEDDEDNNDDGNDEEQEDNN